jgi:hypothetical protein
MLVLYTNEMLTNTNEKNAKKRRQFICEICDFICSKQSDYDRHLSTGKHEILTNPNGKTSKRPKAYMCSCGKSYKHASSLCGHKKKCKIKEQDEIIKELKNEVIELHEVIEEQKETIEVQKEQGEEFKKEIKNEMKEMKENNPVVNDILKQNNEIISIMKDMVPKIGNNNTTTNNTMNNNFNLNVFLNETCKDAMNIKDFIESLRVQCNEMKEIQNIGFIELASKVLLKELSEMDVSKRPIHCSDLKRETLYIKDNNVWEKESESKPTMLTMMKQMQKVSYTTLDIWISKHPGCQRYDHPQHNLFMDTWGDICILDECKDVKKVSKRIAKQVLIDKEKKY